MKTSALIVSQPHADGIVDGAKRWELRSSVIHKRECIGIIAQGTHTIIGTVQIVDCLGPLSPAELDAAQHLHRASRELRANHPKWNHAWVLEAPHRLPDPIPYDHPGGAQSWVTLTPAVCLRLAMAITGKGLLQVAKSGASY